MVGCTSANVQVTANVNGTLVDVVAFTCNYAMNSVPTATLMLAPGREATTLLPSSAHFVATDVTQQMPVEVYLTYSTVATNSVALQPDGVYTIFKGWVTGCGYRRMFNNFGLALDLTHWLSALGFSTMLGSATHPGNPFQMLFEAAQGGLLYGCDWIAKYSAPGAASGDLWGNLLLPFFQRFAAMEGMNFSVNSTMGRLGTVDHSGEITWALSQFQGGPLPMQLDCEDMLVVEQAILMDLGARASDNSNTEMLSMANTTFWDKLVGDFAQTYLFSVIPHPLYARIVPFIPGLTQFWDPSGYGCTILARDTLALNLAAVLPRAIRAVGLMAGTGSLCGNMSDNTDAMSGQIGGLFDTGRPGMVIVKPAPRYLAEIPLGTNMADLYDGIGSSMTPKHGVQRNRKRPQSFITNNSQLLDRFAQALYAIEMLKNRVGSLTSPLRFDICPGSTIKFEVPAGDYTNGMASMGQYMYATVAEAEYSITAENRQANVTYKLAHVRTEAENALPTTAVARHPLYSNVWSGGYML